MQRLFIGLAVLAVLGIGLDRAAEFATGRLVGGRIAEQTQAERRPTVDFLGFPFVTQAARREFDRVDVHLRGIRSRQQLRIERLDVQLRGVRLVQGNRARVEAMTGRGLIVYRDLAEVTGGETEVSYGGDGLVRMTRKVEVLGVQSEVSALGRPLVRDGVLIVRPERFETGVGPLDQVVGRVSVRGFTIRVPLRNLPEGVDVDLSPGPAGIDLRLTGDDLLLGQ
jgi:hypothetical protein